MNLATILGLLSGFFSVFSRILEYFKKEEMKNEGKTELAKEILTKDQEVTAKQTEILIKDESREETIRKLENGTF
jgi:hypothetical protein